MRGKRTDERVDACDTLHFCSDRLWVVTGVIAKGLGCLTKAFAVVGATAADRTLAKLGLFFLVIVVLSFLLRGVSDRYDLWLRVTYLVVLLGHL
jgi:hypothetical protein